MPARSTQRPGAHFARQLPGKQACWLTSRPEASLIRRQAQASSSSKKKFRADQYCRPLSRPAQVSPSTQIQNPGPPPQTPNCTSLRPVLTNLPPPGTNLAGTATQPLSPDPDASKITRDACCCKTHLWTFFYIFSSGGSYEAPPGLRPTSLWYTHTRSSPSTCSASCLNSSRPHRHHHY